MNLEQRVPTEHPLRVIRAIANEALEALSANFSELYSGMGRPPFLEEVLRIEDLAGIRLASDFHQ